MYLKEKTPFVFSLVFQPRPMALVFKIHKAIIPIFKKIDVKNYFLTSVVEKYSYLSFEPDITKDFGFAHSFVNKGIKDNIMTLECCIPKVVSFLEETCETCKGDGKSDFGIGVCHSCRGTGRKQIVDSSKIMGIAATVHVLLRYFDYIVADLGKRKKFKTQGFQQAVLITSIRHDMNGFGIGGKSDQAFIDICKRYPKLVNRRVESAMYRVWCQLKNYQATPNYQLLEKKYSFNSSIGNEGTWHFNVPGVNDCCIYSNKDGDISEHNIDNYWQQIPLLAGLAALWNMVT